MITITTIESFLTLLNRISHSSKRHIKIYEGKTLSKITKDIPNAHGVYIICDSKGEIVYIGKAGEIKQDGTLTKQGLHDRLNNQHNGKSREDDFISKMEESNIDFIITYWYVLDSKEAPSLVEAKLLQKYLDKYRRLPIWNKAF